MSDLPLPPSIPAFVDSFDPAATRKIILTQLVILRGAKSQLDNLDDEAPLVSDLQSSINFQITQRETYLNYTLPRLLEWRAMLRGLREIDDRLRIQVLPRTALVETIWLNLKANETYRDFKFIAGKIALRGFKLIEGKADHDYGSVDFKFTALDGRASLKVYVRPGDSVTCQIVEQTEVREVTVKKIVCDGIETGEMGDAKLTTPTTPTFPASSMKLPASPKESDDDTNIPF